jgi:hypothetical protein
MTGEPRPEVILEFLFDQGNLLIAIRNIGSLPALAVRTELEPAFKGLGGTQDFAELEVFQNIAFLGPQREICFLLDSSAAYFARREPTAVTARLTYADESGQKFETRIRHNLEIFRSLPYLAR